MLSINNKNSGITLLEVLISVLVMAVGMLGFATLQMQTLNVTQESFARAQATAVLENITDDVRSNADFIVTDNQNSLVNYASADVNFNWCSNPPPVCSGACSGDELIQSSMRQACDTINDLGLPNGKIGAICIDRNPGETSDNCSISSKWVFYTSWTPTNREDVTGETDYSQNNECQSEFNLDQTETCVIMELIL